MDTSGNNSDKPQFKVLHIYKVNNENNAQCMYAPKPHKLSPQWKSFDVYLEGRFRHGGTDYNQ
jgi:hypothetical protein